MECNHLDEKRKDIFGGRDVEYFRFHPALILFYLKKCIVTFNLYISDKVFAQFFTLCLYPYDFFILKYLILTFF